MIINFVILDSQLYFKLLCCSVMTLVLVLDIPVMTKGVVQEIVALPMSIGEIGALLLWIELVVVVGAGAVGYRLFIFVVWF